MKPEPFTAASRKRLQKISELLTQAKQDCKAIDKAEDHLRMHLVAKSDKAEDHLRMHLVAKSAYEVLEHLREIETQIDCFGTRRKKEAEELKRRLPAPKPVRVTIVPPREVKQLMLLPGPEVQS